jgi:hypothetical protein
MKLTAVDGNAFRVSNIDTLSKTLAFFLGGIEKKMFNLVFDAASRNLVVALS